MGDLDELMKDEKVLRLLEEAEKAMRLAAEVEGDAAESVRVALDSLFQDIGRTVYNMYWEEDLRTGEHGAELAEISSEIPTEAVPRLTPLTAADEEKSLPGFAPSAIGDMGSVDDDTGWYTSEVEIPDRPMFTASDGLVEDIPESDPIPGDS